MTRLDPVTEKTPPKWRSHTIDCLQIQGSRKAFCQESGMKGMWDERQREKGKSEMLSGIPQQKLYPTPLSELKLPFMCTIRSSQTGMLVECTAFP